MRDSKGVHGKGRRRKERMNQLHFNLKKKDLLVVYTCNSSTREAETGGFWVSGLTKKKENLY